jgi:hypothetical protein
MLSEKKIRKIQDIFKNNLHFSSAEDINTVSNFYWVTNYYLALREDNLQLIFSKITDNEVLNTLIFNSMPLILFNFSVSELNLLVENISNSFIFWSDVNESTVVKTADSARIEQTHYGFEFLQRKMLNEKWIIVLCLFFLYFPAVEILKDYKLATTK